MDRRLDESTGKPSAENAVSCSVDDISVTNKRGKSQTRQQGNANGADTVMGDRKPALPIAESNISEKVSCEEDDVGLPMVNRVESDKLMNCTEGNEDNLAEENPSGSHTMDESDDSDFVVQDVKVCDICGDAGREDLLAICCRCIDGAEHTYCMREMLEKVPEGDWMCDECQYDEEMKNQRQHKVVNEDGNAKTSSSGKASSGNSNACLRSDTRSSNDLDIRSKDRSNMEILGKRPKEDSEVSSLSKRRAVESVIGSPKTSGSKTVASLSQEISPKTLNRGKEKVSHQSSFAAPVGSDDTESASALVSSPTRLTPRGTFLKSNSFSSLNPKPKVKLVDEAVPQKQKSVREPPPLDIKDGTGKPYGKSMSFRSTSSSRYGNGDSKVKMLSPKFSHNQDNIGFKHTKERSVLERKSSFKSERPVINSPRVSYSISDSKNEKNIGCRDENVLASESSKHQPKAVQSDSKTSSLSKIPSLTSRRASGDGKRQSLVSTDFTGAEQKSSNNEELLPSGSAGRPSYGDPNECLVDESSQLKDSVRSDETIRESGNQSKHNTGIGRRNEICQKCKVVGHLARCCPADGLPDVAISKSSREVTNASNDLKAAIEAAMLRKPGICRKSRVADQSNDSTQGSKNGDIVSQDHFVGPVNKKNVYSVLVKDMVSSVPNSTTSCKHASLDNVETSTSRTGDGGLVVPYDGTTSIRDLPIQLPSPISVWKTSDIPEHEFTWQGNFEVHKNDKVECCDGVQGHLSACASPRVLSVVNKFPHKVVLNEAPRLSIWPLQFQEYGVKEDNVALYFFAKDVDSYEKSYKILLENMIKNDLALEAIVDGVELLIFPSTQLPQQSQRWNMLYFLWGVFRGKKVSQSYQVCSFSKQNLSQQDNRTAAVSLPENICSHEPVEKKLASNASLAGETAVSKDEIDVSAVPSLVQVKETDKIKAEPQGGIDSNPLTSLQSNSVKEGGTALKCNPEAGAVQVSAQAFLKNASSSSECMPGQHDSFRISSKIASSQVLAEGGNLNKLITGINHVSHETIMGDASNREDAPLARVSSATEQIKKDLSNTQLKDLNCKRPQDDGKVISEATSTSSCQPIQIDDDDDDVIVLSTLKRRRISSDGSNGSNDHSSSSNDGFSMRIHDVASDSSVNVSGESYMEKVTSSKWGNAERFFFPVTPAPVKHIVDKSTPVETHPLENQVHVAPNLDLALGGETALPSPVIPSFLVDKKVVEDEHPKKQAKGEEEDISGSLSLSLAFPFSDSEQDQTSISRSRQLTERQRPQVNPPFLLFGGIRDK
ncbi:hypothetical protein Leryth_003997 [Lithospermum erythrorhizon]|nr:hypothetical protein Leryth_003997 [Lithospermum erythrorhizon]